MPLDPQIRALLDKGAGVPATHTLSVDVARVQYEARIASMAPPADIAGVRGQTIAGPGGPLRIRLYTPPGTGPFPLLVFFHGSGFVLCSRRHPLRDRIPLLEESKRARIHKRGPNAIRSTWEKTKRESCRWLIEHQRNQGTGHRPASRGG
jgi:hypothetical protein